MSRHSLIRLACLLCATALAAAWSNGVAAAQPNAETARLDSYSQPETPAGKTDQSAKGAANYFALSLTPGAVAPAAGGSDVVVLFNTSAAQTGEYRDQALEALNGLLAGLGDADRVHLMAIDLNAVPMTKDFAAPKSADMAAALQKLKGRVPLGSTDIQQALNAAAASLAAAGSRPKAIVYLGDGMSRANLLSLDAVGELAASLTAARIPVNAYLVGVRVDKQLLGTLAAETGGMVYEASKLPSAQAGATLAAAAVAPVLWPKSVTWPGGFTVFNKRTPPLRADRETVVVGTYPGGGPFTLQMAVEGPSGARNLSWNVAASPSKEENSYLARLVDKARSNQGVGLPLLGSASLKDAEREIDASVVGLTQLGVQALSAGDMDGAERLARAALQQDPQNVQAQNLAQAVAKRRANGQAAAPAKSPAVAGAPAPAGTDLNLVAPAAAQPPAAGPFAAPGALAESVQTERRLIEQQMTAEVTNTINQARKRLATEPGPAIQGLKLQLDRVAKTPELNPDVRERMMRQLQAAIRESEMRKEELDHVRLREQENLAAAKERMLVLDNLSRRQEKIRQLMDRFNSLMEEGRYRLAEEAAAMEAEEIAEQKPVLDDALQTAQSAAINARSIGYLQEAMVLREARQKGVVDTLYQVEKSHVPFPDEPPIIYPAAEVWQELTVRRKKKYTSMDLANRGPAEQKITAALKAPTTLEFMETPLSDVVEYLKDLHKIEIQLDTKALSDVGVSPDTPITRNLKGVALRSALRLMLGELDLTYVIDNEVLLLTTPEKADAKLATKVYPVADLVIPIQTPMGGAMGMGMMGGGGMGGMGGGMGGMGGGMGGMGGGMGGMGGGMGMFNVPGMRQKLQQFQQQQQQQGMNLFSVKDELNLTPDKGEKRPDGKEASRPAAPRAAKPAPARVLEVAVEPGKSAAEAWEAFFAKNDPKPADIRETVRKLWEKKQYGQVVDLVQAALRHKHVQPWMYEALTLALLAGKRPREEIERAVMSAVDFAENPSDLMLIGAYLEQLDMPKRSLQIYRQVSRIMPLWPEPHQAALRVARDLNDLEAIQWATIGILSQAWTNDQQDVWENGRRVAAATLDRLKSEGRADEAKRYEKALDEAVIRDCVAIIHWSGDADLDLLVQEPTGTVCSLRNPRTAAGGVMLGDGFSATGKKSAEGLSEIYVCPKSFSGDYSLIVRRVWGKVTANKVTVDLYLHARSPKEKHYQQTITLKGDEARVNFPLADGRRTESLKDFQVARAADDQINNRRQILAQQLAGGVDPTAIGNLMRNRLATTTSGGLNTAGGLSEASSLFSFLRRGAVGYQPVIIMLPEGAQLSSALAVISADRRYVRFTGLPMFSGVGEVNTFNMVTGSSGQSGGGTGGQGFGGSGMGGGGNNAFGGGR